MAWFSKDYTVSDLHDLAYEWIPEEPKEYDPITYDALVQWRDGFADEHQLDPVDVMTDQHLKMVASTRPTEDEEFKEIGLDKARIQVLGGALSAYVAAQQLDWHGVVRTAVVEDGAYEVPGADEVKNVSEDFLTETDSLGDKL